jgi:hypothetical protein
MALARIANSTAESEAILRLLDAEVRRPRAWDWVGGMFALAFAVGGPAFLAHRLLIHFPPPALAVAAFILFAVCAVFGGFHLFVEATAAVSLSASGVSYRPLHGSGSWSLSASDITAIRLTRVTCPPLLCFTTRTSENRRVTLSPAAYRRIVVGNPDLGPWWLPWALKWGGGVVVALLLMAVLLSDGL